MAKAIKLQNDIKTEFEFLDIEIIRTTTDGNSKWLVDYSSLNFQTVFAVFASAVNNPNVTSNFDNINNSIAGELFASLDGFGKNSATDDMKATGRVMDSNNLVFFLGGGGEGLEYGGSGHTVDVVIFGIKNN